MAEKKQEINKIEQRAFSLPSPKGKAGEFDDMVATWLLRLHKRKKEHNKKQD